MQRAAGATSGIALFEEMAHLAQRTPLTSRRIVVLDLDLFLSRFFDGCNGPDDPLAGGAANIENLFFSLIDVRARAHRLGRGHDQWHQR